MDSKRKFKTIFFSCFFGYILRNVLSTDCLRILRQEHNIRIVILTHKSKKTLVEKEVGGDDVIVEGVEPRKLSIMDIFFRSLSWNLLDTRSRYIHRLIKLKRDRKYHLFLVYWLLAKVFGKFKAVRRFVRWLEFKVMPKDRFNSYFDKYGPDAVFSGDIQNPDDVALMREAKYRRVPLIGMPRSWDCLTTKGIVRVLPDRWVANTEIMREEAVRYSDADPKRISLIGVPHYDTYLQAERTPRQEFFKQMKLDWEKKLIFFAPPCEEYVPGGSVASKILEALNELGDNIQVLVRFPIVGTLNLNDDLVSDKIVFDKPDNYGSFASGDLTKKTDFHLADSLYHSDVVMIGPSTLIIDAAIFDKPIILIGFDGKPVPYWDSLKRYYDYDHLQSTMQSGGVKLAKDTKELVEYAGRYLVKPQLDQDGRKRIVVQRCWRLDGRSSRRLADAILEILSR